MPMERLHGMATPNGVGPLTRGMGSLAKLVAASYGAPGGGWQPPMARAHQQRSANVFPRAYGLGGRQSVDIVCPK